MVIDADEAARVELDPGGFKADVTRHGRSADCDQQVGRGEMLIAGGRAHGESHTVAGAPVNLDRLGAADEIQPVFAGQGLHSVGNVNVLVREKVRCALDDYDAAAKAVERLAKLGAYVPAAQDQQVLGHGAAVAKISAVRMGSIPSLADVRFDLQFLMVVSN